MATEGYAPGVPTSMKNRFRGYLPVVVDMEFSGLDPAKHAVLEIAAIVIGMTDDGQLVPEATAISTHVVPFEGAKFDPKSMEVNGIDPHHPLRAARSERDALGHIFTPIRKAIKEAGCTRAILVGHNAWLDLGFLNASVERAGIKRNPFHPFSSFDTVTMAGMAVGQTVLARAAVRMGLPWDPAEAHSAVYDTRQTAELFCKIINRWEMLNRAELAPDPVTSQTARPGNLMTKNRRSPTRETRRRRNRPL